MEESFNNSSKETGDDNSSTASVEIISNNLEDSFQSEASVEYEEPVIMNAQSSGGNSLYHVQSIAEHDSNHAVVNVVTGHNDDVGVVNIAAEYPVINNQSTGIANAINSSNQNISQNMNNVLSTANNRTVLKINHLNTNVDVPWRVRAIVEFKHPTKSYSNANGFGEITTWDLVDDTSSINLVAFNLQSSLLVNNIDVGHCYEFSNLSIRSSDQLFKTLPNDYELVARSSTTVQEIQPNFVYNPVLNFIDLRAIEQLPLNSVVDVDVRVLRDNGITAGFSNNNPWTRRELHIAQDGFQSRITLWNDIARQLTGNVINSNIKFKNVKISWFNGSRILVTLPNTRFLMNSTT